MPKSPGAIRKIVLVILGVILALVIAAAAWDFYQDNLVRDCGDDCAVRPPS